MNPYLAGMARRFFLTLLALLTGLSVPGTLVQARDVSAQRAEIRAVSTIAEARQATLAASLPASRLCASNPFGASCAEPFAAVAVDPAPRVLVRIDCAHE